MDKRLVSGLFAIGIAGTLASLIACGREERTPLIPTTIAQSTVSPSAMVVEGTIQGLAAPQTIVVSGNTIQLAPDAGIRSGSIELAFADLRLGARSRVTAVSDGGTLRASLVEVLDPVGTQSFTHGMMTRVLLEGDTFQFNVDDRLVRGDAATQVLEGARQMSSSSLHDGVIVDVDGLQRAEHLYATAVRMKAPDTGNPAPSPAPSPSPGPSPAPSPSPGPSPPPGPSPSPVPPLPTPPPSGDVTVGGVVGSMSGTCPALVFTVNGTTVVTDQNTGWQGGTCASLTPGGSARASGTRNGNAVVARNVTIGG